MVQNYSNEYFSKLGTLTPQKWLVISTATKKEIKTEKLPIYSII